MNAAAIVFGLALSFAGFAALALSLDRHHRAVFRRPVPRGRIRGLRLAGWAGLALSLAGSIACAGWTFGPVQWFGVLTGGALLVVATIAFRPGWLRPAALAALPFAAAALPYALSA